MRRLLIAALVVAASCGLSARDASAQAPAELYYTTTGKGLRQPGAPRRPVRPFISFRTGEAGGDELGDKQDLGFGLLKINHEDWFEIRNGDDGGGRSVIRDLGEHAWSDVFDVPALAPLPELKPGEQRVVKVDASADTHGKWARATTIFAKVRVGHMYAARVVRGASDLYVLFRVESHEQNESCSITWRIVPPPAEARAGRVR